MQAFGEGKPSSAITAGHEGVGLRFGGYPAVLRVDAVACVMSAESSGPVRGPVRISVRGPATWRRCPPCLITLAGKGLLRPRKPRILLERGEAGHR